MPELPSLLVVRCLCDEQPFAGAWVLVALQMWRKNAYTSLHGPADERGILEIFGEEMIAAADEQRRVAMMDYADPRAEFSGKVSVAPANIEAAERAIHASRQLDGYMKYPPQYAAQLELLASRLSQLGVRSSVSSFSLRIQQTFR